MTIESLPLKLDRIEANEPLQISLRLQAISLYKDLLITKQQEESKKATDEINRLQLENGKLKGDIQKVTNERNQLQLDNGDLKEDIKRVTDEKNQLQSENGDLKEDIESHRARIKMLKEGLTNQKPFKDDNHISDEDIQFRNDLFRKEAIETLKISHLLGLSFKQDDESVVNRLVEIEYEDWKTRSHS
ncbi:hypothetical protein COLO4_30342 [Corchorus olitorius]|uniref:Uncharacterized protein n=1 Tax=Corchorus olitorius TaxID=93759 RepID=A0A1R3H8Y1_9ROSI|nr:hypothetical protein COLO4_30342 [Corchorus olitorius]